jgi:hypothetical protein
MTVHVVEEADLLISELEAEAGDLGLLETGHGIYAYTGTDCATAACGGGGGSGTSCQPQPLQP